MFYGFMKVKLVLVSRNHDISLLILRLPKCLPLLCDSSFAATLLKAYESLGHLSSSKGLEFILIYSNFHSFLAFNCVDTRTWPLAVEHSDLELQQEDSCGVVQFLCERLPLSLSLFMSIASLIPNTVSTFLFFFLHQLNAKMSAQLGGKFLKWHHQFSF